MIAYPQPLSAPITRVLICCNAFLCCVHFSLSLISWRAPVSIFLFSLAAPLAQLVRDRASERLRSAVEPACQPHARHLHSSERHGRPTRPSYLALDACQQSPRPTVSRLLARRQHFGADGRQQRVEPEQQRVVKRHEHGTTIARN